MDIFTRPPTVRGPAETFPRDTVCTAPGEEHWHGAAPDRFIAHLALMEGDGSDAPQTSQDTGPVADYAAPRTSTRRNHPTEDQT